MEKFYSNSPHVKSGNSTRKIMLNVCIALLPACVMGVVYFGLKALLILCLSVISAIGAEVVYLLICKKPLKTIIKEFDCSSVVTGLLLGMILSSNVEWYVPVLSAIFAIVAVKMIFGGTGKNVVNPAITGRIFAFMAFGSVLSGWLTPMSGDPVTGPTTLTGFLENGTFGNVNLLHMFLGYGMSGCIGETCKLALIVGGVYLVIRGIIDFKWPLIYIAVTGLTTVCLNEFNFSVFLPSILSGGLVLGAIFMATDYTTSPNTTLGNVIYFIFLGVITAVLRSATKIEVVSFAILLGNLIVPLIDKFIYPRPFGYRKAKEKK